MALSVRTKLILYTLAALVALFAFYFFISQYLLNKVLHNPSRAIATSGDNTSTWQSYKWRGASFQYPGDWYLEQIFAKKSSAQMNSEKEVVGFVIRPLGQKNKDDEIAVGGYSPSCETLARDYRLCLGYEPIYTNSKNPDVLILFNRLVKTSIH